MLSGQGSQYYQMGNDLFEGNSLFRKNFLSLDEIARDYLDISVAEEIYSVDKTTSDLFDDPVLSSISLLLFELAIVETLKDRGVEPDMLLGSSFGTFVSVLIAGCLGIEEGIRVLAEQGSIFKETCEDGCMLAVLGPSRLFHGDPLLQEVSELASINYSNNFVLSLPSRNLEKVEAILKASQCVYQEVAVATAYHSKWIENAKSRFFELYERSNFEAPKIPIICTNTTKCLNEVNVDVLWNVVRGPVRFWETIKILEDNESYCYIDVGPSGTLATFLKYSLTYSSKSQVFPIVTPFRKSIRNLDSLHLVTREHRN
jgi:acyl transferase domain-containing protein